MPAGDKTKRLIWVRAGGRCILCNKNLITTSLGDGAAVRSIGEVAHIAAESLDGPRGDSPTDPDDRNDAENLLLLCPNEHTEADSGRLSDPQYTEDFLRARKRNKEAWIEFVTGLDAQRATTILRLSGDVRGSTCLIDRHEAAKTTMRTALRTPQYLPDPWGVGLTIDIADVPGPGTANYWASCLSQIDSSVDRLRRSAQEGDTTHVSVFAFALVPLLVALGNALDDTLQIDVYDRHRATDSWFWDPHGDAVRFQYAIPETVDSAEATLVVNASGTIQPHELPAEVAELPRIVVEPAADHIPGPVTFAAKATLDAFTTTVRDLIAELERHKHIRHLHLFLATPVSATVNLGRVWPVDNAAPSITIYHRANDNYQPAIDLPRTQPVVRPQPVQRPER